MRRSKTGTPIHFFPRCRTCTRLAERDRNGADARPVGRRPRDLKADWQTIKADPRRMDSYREYHRIYQEGLRRKEGVKPREFKTEERSKGKPFNWGQDAVDSGPFLSWIARWKASQDAARSPGNPAIDLQDLAELAGCSGRTFYRARETGRISINVVDSVLIAAGGNSMLIDLYPELYPDVDID